MLELMVEGARLKMLMAWCSTLGGAHSSLGEHSISHVSLHHKIMIYPILMHMIYSSLFPSLSLSLSPCTSLFLHNFYLILTQHGTCVLG